MFQLSLYGKCEVRYYAGRTQPGAKLVTVDKERDVDSCRMQPEGKDLGRWRTFIHAPKCGPSGAEQQTITGVTSSTRYLVAMADSSGPEIHRIDSIETTWLDPFGVAASSMKANANWTIQLEKTRRWTEPLPARPSSTQDHLKFQFGLPDHQEDLKGVQNLMLHPEPYLAGQQEGLRRKSQLDLLNAVQGVAESPDHKINLDQLPLAAISYQLGSLDYANLRALYRDLTVASSNEKLHSAK